MSAPYFAELADGPDDGEAAWLEAADGRLIRAGHWGAGAEKGTVFLLPGRTEYIEKYGRAARDLRTRGYATLSVDWRGQGLASRVLDDPVPGHVGDFAEYQLDLAALIAHARGLGLPEPFFMLAHSMGGCIGLRAVMGEHPFKAVAFSAPMWGIHMPGWQRPVARVGAALAQAMGLGARYAPSTGPATYVTAEPFEGNVLTTDPEMWAYMGTQVRGEPRLALGGPTLAWLHAALVEMRALAEMASPALPCHVGLGGQEQVVDPRRIRERMQRWPGGQLEEFPEAQHELMMERRREEYFDQVVGLFDAER